MKNSDRERLLSAFKTKLQIIHELRLGKSTFYRLLDAKGIKLPSTLLNRKHQKIIYDELGYPYGISKKDFQDV